jgi:hypothetical protein
MASTGDHPYDPYIPAEGAAGGAAAGGAQGNQRTAALQAVSDYMLFSFPQSQDWRWIDGFANGDKHGKDATTKSRPSSSCVPTSDRPYDNAQESIIV